jgi:uncharacterized tellurite resistance protein B-like protein
MSANTWRVEDFITFLYNIAADADLVIDELEVASTKVKVDAVLKKYFPGIDYDYYECIQVIKKSKSVNIFNVSEIVTTLSSKFHFSAELKTEIISDLTDIVSSDELVTSGEHEAVNKIRALFKK